MKQTDTTTLLKHMKHKRESETEEFVFCQLTHFSEVLPSSR